MFNKEHMNPALRTLCSTLIIAVTYNVAGVLGLLLTHPISYMMLAAAPAGIGLALIILWGMRALPGVMLGALTLGITIALLTKAAPLSTSIILCLGTPLSAITQALTGYWLVKKYMPLPANMEQPRNVALLMLLGGPVSCLISPTMNSLILYLLNELAPGGIASYWYTSWLSNVISVTTLTPLLLIVLARDDQISQYRKYIVSISLLLLCFIGIYIFSAMLSHETSNEHQHFERKVDELEQDLQLGMNEQLYMLIAMKSYFEVTQNVTNENFMRFTQPLFSNKPFITGVSWVPHIRHKDRSRFERSMRAQGLTDYVIRTNTDKGLEISGTKPDYFPIAYTHPSRLLQKVQGFDIQSEPQRSRIIAEARDSGEPRVLTPITLLADKNAPGMIVYIPVFKGSEDTVSERREHLMGIVGVGFIISHMLAPSIKEVQQENMQMSMYATGADNKPYLLYTSHPEKSGQWAFSQSGWYQEKPITFAGSQLIFRFNPLQETISLRHHGILWSTLTGETLLIALISALVLMITARIDTAQRLVSEKSFALESSRQHIQSIINHMGDGLIAINQHGFIQIYNPACEKIFGYPAAEIIGQNISILIPQDIRNIDNGSSANHSPSPALPAAGAAREFQARHKNGHIFPVEITITIMRLIDDMLYTATIRDISERKKAEIQKQETEEELRVSRERLELGWRGAGNGMWDWDITTNVVTFSDRMKELMGYKPHELKHHFDEWARHLHPDDVQPTMTTLQAHLAHNTPYDVDYRMHLKSGEWRWFHARGQAVWDENNKPLRMAGSIADITERKFSEDIRDRLIKQLTNVNEQLEQFAYVASHDLREPLRIVISFTDLLVKEHGDNLQEDALNYMQICRKAAKKMEAMVADLLEYGRLNHEIERLEQINCEKKLAMAMEALSEAISSTGTRIESGPLPCIIANPLRFSRLLQNLISNAIKYQHPNNTPVIRISATDKGDHWLFAITDNGIGIKKEYQEIIFAPFKRLHNDQQYAGTGIGLAICRKIVEDFGGTLWVESEPGKGSSFLFTIQKQNQAPGN